MHKLIHRSTAHTQIAYTQAAYTQTAYTQIAYTQTAYTQTAHTQTAYTQTAYTQTAYTQTAYTQTAYTQTAYMYTQTAYTQTAYYCNTIHHALPQLLRCNCRCANQSHPRARYHTRRAQRGCSEMQLQIPIDWHTVLTRYAIGRITGRGLP